VRRSNVVPPTVDFLLNPTVVPAKPAAEHLPPYADVFESFRWNRAHDAQLAFVKSPIPPTRRLWLTRFILCVPTSSRLLQRLLQKLDSAGRDLVAGGFDPTPDGCGAGNDLHVRGERFDYDVALVLNILQRLGDRFPINVIVAGRAAVAAAGVEMAKQLAGFANG